MRHYRKILRWFTLGGEESASLTLDVPSVTDEENKALKKLSGNKARGCGLTIGTNQEERGPRKKIKRGRSKYRNKATGCGLKIHLIKDSGDFKFQKNYLKYVENA